jgi:porphobilinogen deaminase
MNTTRLVRRIERIAARRHDRIIWAAAGVIATRLGVTPQEVMDEADRLHQAARQLGTTAVEVVARECDMTVDEVWSEVAQQWGPIASRGGA